MLKFNLSAMEARRALSTGSRYGAAVSRGAFGAAGTGFSVAMPASTYGNATLHMVTGAGAGSIAVWWSLIGAVLCALAVAPAWAGGNARHHNAGDSWIMITGSAPGQAGRQEGRSPPQPILLTPPAPSSAITPAAVRARNESVGNNADFRMQMTPAERRQLREDVSNASRSLYAPRGDR